MNEVIIITQGNENTGINKYAINTHMAMNDISHLFFIKFRKNHENYQYGRSIQGRFYYRNSPINLNSLFPKIAYSNFVNYLKEQKIKGTLIHISSPHVLKIAPGFDNIVTIHDMYPFLNVGSNNSEYFLTRILYKHYLKFNHILTVSDYVKKMVEDIVIQGNVNRIYPYISDNFVPLNDKIKLRKKYDLPLDRKLIISVSTNIPRKNLKILPEVFSRLGNDYKLVRIGESVGNSYTFTPSDEVQMNEIYNACDALLSTSLDEGFGFPLIEGLKAGLPVVASDIPVHREILGEFGFYFDPTSIKDIAIQVKESLKVKKDNDKNLSKWLSKFNFDEFKKQMREYYDHISKES